MPTGITTDYAFVRQSGWNDSKAGSWHLVHHAIENQYSTSFGEEKNLVLCTRALPSIWSVHFHRIARRAPLSSFFQKLLDEVRNHITPPFPPQYPIAYYGARME
jgi:hypothetical protein